MRINNAHLDRLVDVLNHLSNSPLEYSSTKKGEKFKANIGHYYIAKAYGGNKLVRVASEGGGIEEITYGFVPKKELYKLMSTYINGMRHYTNNDLS